MFSCCSEYKYTLFILFFLQFNWLLARSFFIDVMNLNLQEYLLRKNGLARKKRFKSTVPSGVHANEEKDVYSISVVD